MSRRVSVRFGGTISAPVAQKILADTLPYLGVEPKYTEKEQANLSRTTPKVVDKEVAAAENMINNSELKAVVVGHRHHRYQAGAGGRQRDSEGRHGGVVYR